MVMFPTKQSAMHPSFYFQRIYFLGHRPCKYNIKPYESRVSLPVHSKEFKILVRNHYD
jgi:hypothetical protein